MITFIYISLALLFLASLRAFAFLVTRHFTSPALAQRPDDLEGKIFVEPPWPGDDGSEIITDPICWWVPDYPDPNGYCPSYPDPN